VLADLYRLTGGRIPLVGCGGVASGADAYAKIRAGASLVQLYTALVYEGPGLVRRIKDELAARLKADGFASVAEAVGVGPSR
jgi:dihydroorotate dehydrogenase